jgi:hypothetical protein
MLRKLSEILILVAGLIPAVSAGSSAWAGEHRHADDFEIGVSAGGQLEAVFDEDEAFLLPPVDGLLQGWAAGDPGFLSVEENEPDKGLFVLDAEADIVLEVLALDPAFKLRDAGFVPIPPGGQFALGMPPIHIHPGAWHIDSTDPGFMPSQTIWQGTFRLIDLRPDGHAPSEPFTRLFTNVEPHGDGEDAQPVPAVSATGMLTLAVLLAGLLALCFGRPKSANHGKRA